jgi:arginyl-tRNA synthetase
MPTYEKTYLKDMVSRELLQAYRSLGDVAGATAVEIRPSERPEFGDYSTNLAMTEAKASGRAPRHIAEALVAALAKTASTTGIAKAEVAGPGFVNLFLSPECIRSALRSLLAEGEEYGCSQKGEALQLQVEFVSSNPTGPLTVGHGRQAVLGDVLAALHERLGYDVQREYYFNDQGRQVDLLAESLWIRYRELFGESHEIPEGGYQGEYLKDMAVEVRPVVGDGYEEFNADTLMVFRAEAVTRISAGIREDLVALGVDFKGRFFSEATLHDSGKVDAALKELRAHDAVYDEGGAVWLRAEDFGGAKDSVLIRSDGRPTYMMVDIAYHMDKRDRGFERVIDVQGADHQVEQTCVKAALRALGIPETFLRYAVHQFVSLKQGGAVQRMSTRAGRFVTLRDLLDEVGPDVVRYFMISRKPEAHLEFDLDLAKSQSLDNPATYIQYAHTRIVSLFRKAGVDTISADVDLAPLEAREELDLVKKLDLFPEVLDTAATSFAPHLVAEYALDVARSFHAYYDRFRVLGEADAVIAARLALLHAVRIVLAQSLGILGMTAPKEM